MGPRVLFTFLPQQRGQASSMLCDSNGIFLLPDSSQLSMKSCYIASLIFHCCSSPSPRGQELTTSFTDSADRQARFWCPPRDDSKERNFFKGCLAIILILLSSAFLRGQTACLLAPMLLHNPMVTYEIGFREHLFGLRVGLPAVTELERKCPSKKG